jgi:metaxin
MPPDGESKSSTNGVPAPDSTDKAIDPKNVSPTSAFSRQAQNVRDFFSVPAPVKRLFEAVPLLVYESNELPERALKVKGGGKGTRGGNVPSLYVFAKEEDARSGRPSFNPGCLRWQVSFLAWRVMFDILWCIAMVRMMLRIFRLF